MDDKQQKNVAKKPRTQPPTLEERKPSSAENGKSERDVTGERCVVIRIPVGMLQEDGEAYQVSRRGWPREVRQRRLTSKQGMALAMIRLGMLARGECLDADERYFLAESGEAKKVAIESKEEVICRLLEYVSNAIDGDEGG